MDATTVQILQDLVKYGQYVPTNTRQINACVKLRDNDIVQINYNENNGVYLVKFKENKIIEIMA